MLYMLPQGGIGRWLMATCLKQPIGLSRSLCIFGFVSGVGLLLVGVSFVAIAAAQGPELWAILTARALRAVPPQTGRMKASA